MTDEITELVELLREALFQQPDAVEGWHAPWVSDAATPPGLIQVDGDLDLNILAAALSGWVRQQQAEAIQKAFYMGWSGHHKAGNPPMAYGHLAGEAWDEYRTRLDDGADT